ncbi:recombination protein [Vibrio phage 1.244.A._10N.261.54.C3]|nr:recombination protein [Vibrio phage 1.244.A._10N.261.54.C3]AUR98644.1 recombination protein [Vibrio phage 1.255.O._10N.286.45.F1]
MSSTEKSFLEGMPKSDTIEFLQNRMEELFAMDSVNLDKEALRQDKLYFEVQRYYIQEGQVYRFLLEKFEGVKLFRRKYYLRQLPESVYRDEPLNPFPMKSEVDYYLKADPLIWEMRQLVDEQDAKVNYLESAIQRAKARSFDIKNAIQWRCMLEGRM